MRYPLSEHSLTLRNTDLLASYTVTNLNHRAGEANATMNETQWQWLSDIAKRIPSLFQAIGDGQPNAATLLGERTIGGRTVRLTLRAEVIDPGADPLHSHASVNFPAPDIVKPDDMTVPKPRNRKRSKRW